MQAGSTSVEPPVQPTPKSHTGRNVAVVVIVLIVLILVLFVIPFPHNFSDNVTTEFIPAFGAGATVMNFPSGSAVSGSYSSVLGISGLLIRDSGGHVVFDGAGVSGSFSFTASNPPYYAAAACLCLGSVTVSGTYNSPLIPSVIPSV
jgi:hypothetical protein